ncbi:unnamed protein product, partial [marine sediment metagenome]
KKRSENISRKNLEKLDISMGEDYINQTFDMLDSEIDKAKRREIKKARRKKLKGWKRLEKMNCGRDNKKRLKRRTKKGGE